MTRFIIIALAFSVTLLVSCQAARSEESLKEYHEEKTRVETINKILTTMLNDGTKSKDLFKAWHHLIKPDYSLNSEVAVKKYKNFKKTVKEVKETNEKNLSYKFGLNQFSDLSDEEFAEKYLMKPEAMQKHLNENLELSDKKSSDKPKFLQDEVEYISPLDKVKDDDEDEPIVKGRKEISWRSNLDWVRSQGSCGSCWAFTTASAVEGAYGVQRNSYIGYLSTQQLVDCDSGNGGCNGGWYTNSFNYVKNNGLVNEDAYKYNGTKNTCAFNSSIVPENQRKRIAGVETCSECSVDQIHSLLSKGPVAVVIDANKIKNYILGEFESSSCSEVNHAVTLVGYYPGNWWYNETWTVRNSWGMMWGELGHIRVKVKGNSCLLTKYGFRPYL